MTRLRDTLRVGAPSVADDPAHSLPTENRPTIRVTPRWPDEARGVAIEAVLGFDGDAELAPVSHNRGRFRPGFEEPRIGPRHAGERQMDPWAAERLPAPGEAAGLGKVLQCA
jgi:hypothetical protein